MKRDKGIMSDELFEIVLKNIEAFNVGYVMLGGTGEPFLDEKIIERIRSLKKRGVHVTVTTNGSLLDAFDPAIVVESGIDKISVSMDAIDDSYFHKIKPGIKKDMEEIEKAISAIYNFKKKIGSDSPFILLRYQILENSNNMTDKEREKDIILAKRKKICDDVMLRRQHDWRGTKKEHGNAIKSYATPKNVCNFLCRSMKITWSGEISFCCMDYDNNIVLGNLFDDSIDTIFNSAEINQARKMFLNGTINEHPLCSGCYSKEGADV